MNNRQRVLLIEKLLREYTDENHSITGREIERLLAEEHGISVYRSTIADDIAALIASGMDIKIERSIQKQYRYVGRIFDRAELKLMIDAVNAAKFITKGTSKNLVDKICTLAGPDRTDLERHGEVENRAKSGNKKLFLVIDAIHEAIERKRQISFLYFKYDVNKKQVLLHDSKPYLFNPFFLVWNGEYYYMVGSYVNHPETVASFRVDRIPAVPQILKYKALPAPKGFHPNQYLNSRIHMFGGPDQTSEMVTLICENSTVNGIIDRFGIEVDMAPVDEDHFKAKVSVIPTSVFYGWVFGFGGRVRIAGPEEVVGEYRQMIHKSWSEAQ